MIDMPSDLRKRTNADRYALWWRGWAALHNIHGGWRMTVYVVGHSPRTGPVKLGYTENLDDRLRSLRRGETCPLSVHQRFSRSRPPEDLGVLYQVEEGGRDLERHLHFIFRSQRIEGEWFSLGQSPGEVVGRVAQAVRVFAFQPALGLPDLLGPAGAEPAASEPLTHLGEQAARHHEMFRAWVDAGFTEDQAMRLLLAAVDREHQT